MKRLVKRIAVAVLVVLLVVVVGGGIFAKVQASAFDESMAKVYDVPMPTVTRTTDPVALERGKRLANSVGGCTADACHGANLSGGSPIEFGPLATVTGPNVTTALANYSDGEMARLIKHGVKKDGHSVLFMPVSDFGWLPAADVDAIISYLRTVPKVEKPNGLNQVNLIGKVLDRRGAMNFDVARRIDHSKKEEPPPPAPTKEYGAFVVRTCVGCHGEAHLAGGPIPGAPDNLPKPLNLTPHETGLKDWSYEDFDKLLTTGIRKNGKKLDPFMPFEGFAKYDDTEKHALWAYLTSLPPTPYGQR